MSIRTIMAAAIATFGFAMTAAAAGAPAGGTLGVTATVVRSAGFEVAASSSNVQMRVLDGDGGAMIIRRSAAERSLIAKFKGNSLVVSGDVINVSQDGGWRVIREDVAARPTKTVTYEMWGF